MHRLSRLFTVILAVLILILGFTWLVVSASEPSGPRSNPEIWDRLSGVVVVDPGLAGPPDPLAPSLPLDFHTLLRSLGIVPTGPNVLANQDLTNKAQNEPSIDVNPTNPNHIIASSNDYRLRVNPPPQGDVRPGYYVSFDGGLTWPGDGIIDISSIPNAYAGGDPAIAIHDFNNVYYAYIAFNRTVDDAGGVAVSKSTDGGITWLPPVVLAWNTLTIFHDKEYVAVDSSGGPFDGNVYVSWTRFQYDYPIFFSRSTDGGATFSNPITVSDANLVYNQGSIPAVGPDGTLYIAWFNFNQNSIRINKSTNGGASFGTPVQVAAVSEIPSPLPGGDFRDNSFPTLAVDPTNGYVYVAWSDFRNGDADIYFARSTDGGTSWSAPMRVNDDPLYNNAHQFFPWMDVAPNGKIYIGWFDSRLDPSPLVTPMLYDEFVAASTDSGLSFSPNQRISEITSDSSQGGFSTPFIGDYSGIAATNDFVYPAWVDTRRMEQDIFTQQNLSVQGLKLAPAWVEHSQPFTYEINLTSPTDVAGNQLADPLPADTSYVPGSAWASSGIVNFTSDTLTWTGDISATVPISITFDVTPLGTACTSITNTAVLTTGLGASFDLTATSIISGPLPAPAFSFTGAELVYTFTNETPGTISLSYLWDFGDGTTSSEENPVHEYAVPGAYQVSLTAANLCGSAEVSQPLQATCSPPVPAFDWLGNELTISFTNQSSGRFPLTHLWDFGDGITSTLASPVYTYAAPGVFDVSLASTDLCGTADVTQPVTATCTAPTALFTWASAGLEVTFTDQSSGTQPLTYLWDFGDGTTSTEPSPTHEYAAPGVYTVSLAVTAPCGTDVYTTVIRAGNFIFMPLALRR